MKKSFTTLCLLVATLFAFQANAELWLIGNISPDGWVTNKGMAFTQVDDNNYTLDLDVTTTGQQYYSLTTQLSTSSDDWDGIQQYRFGGSMEVPLDTETELQANTGNSPWTNFTQAGTYTFTFNVSTKILKVSFKNAIVVPTFNGTIYIDKASTGNIWAWDNDGNYFDNWPGKAINTLETAQVNGTEYYSFTYTHDAANPGLIFNDGSNQTSDLVPQDGMVYFYTGGNSVTITDPTAPVTIPDLYLFGPAAQGWDPTTGDLMTYDETTETYSISINPESPTTFSFTTKLAENENDWDAIATYRFGADTDGNDFIVKEEHLNTELTLIQTDQPGHAFAIPAGQYTLTVDLNNKKLTITGTITPIEPEPTKVYILGNVVGDWDPTVGQEMATEDGEIFTANLSAVDAGDGNSYFSFTKKLGSWDEIAMYRFGAQSEGDYWVTAENIHNAIPLVDNGHTLRIPTGEYTLTVNLTDMTLLIGGEIITSKPGDANGDGTVDVNDVTTTINYILGKNPNPFNFDNANVNGDANVDVMDVTLIINIILGIQ